MGPTTHPPLLCSTENIDDAFTEYVQIRLVVHKYSVVLGHHSVVVRYMYLTSGKGGLGLGMAEGISFPCGQMCSQYFI